MINQTTGSIINNAPSTSPNLDQEYQALLQSQGSGPQSQEPGYLGVAKAFLENAANSATLGIPNFVSSLETKFPAVTSVAHVAALAAGLQTAAAMTDPNSDFSADLKSDAQQHPLASIAGQVAGGTVPFILTGTPTSLGSAAAQGATISGVTSANENLARLNNTDWNSDSVGHAIANIAFQSILGELGGGTAYGINKLLTKSGELAIKGIFGNDLETLAQYADAVHTPGQINPTEANINDAAGHLNDILSGDVGGRNYTDLTEDQLAAQDQASRTQEYINKNTDLYNNKILPKMDEIDATFADKAVTPIANLGSLMAPVIAKAIVGGSLGGAASGIFGKGFLNPAALIGGAAFGELAGKDWSAVSGLKQLLTEQLSKPDILSRLADMTVAANDIGDLLTGPLSKTLATSTGASLPNATYDTIMNNVNTLNPDQVVSALAPLASPDEHQSAVQSITNAITRIKNTYNGDTPPQDPLSPIQQDVPNDALLNMNRLIQAYNDPMSTLQDGLESGVLHPEALAAIKEAYPDLYSKIQANLVNAYGSMTQDQKLNIPASRLDTLRQILGTPDPNLNVQPISPPPKAQPKTQLKVPDISSTTSAVQQRLGH